MDALGGLTFGERELLALLASLPLAAWFLMARERIRRRRSEAFASVRIRGLRFPARPLRPWVLLIGIAFALLALAGPRLGHELRPAMEDQGSMVIAIDVSSSMAAEDLGVSRLTAAKVVARRILTAESGRVALVAFESVGQLMSPLTTDGAAIADLVETLVPGELSIPGSDLGAAILTAVDYLERSGSGEREVVLLSDGEDQGTLLDRALLAAKEKGVRVSTVLVGSEAGATIPSGEGVMEDEAGREVISAADPATMRRIADQTGGAFVPNPFDEASLENAVVRTTSSEISSEEGRMLRVPVERFQWPLAAAVFSFLFGSYLHRGAE